MPRRVIGFDPGFERLGVAIIEKEERKETLLFSDCLRTEATLPFHERLGQLGKEIEVIIKKHKPTAMALEEVYFAKNAKTAMKIAEVRGMLIYLSQIHHLSLFEYTPPQIKVAITGHGQSDKRAVAHMVSRLLTLPAKKRIDDEIDAIAIALTCLASERLHGAIHTPAR